jgi:hypothetical protein
MTQQSGVKIEAHERPSDFHPQDWIVVVEALAQWAGPPEEADGRRERAYELIEGIASEQDLEPSMLLSQIGWRPP